MLLSVMVPSDDEEHIRRTAYRARRRRRESDTGITGGIVLRSSSGSHGRRLVSLNPYDLIISQLWYIDIDKMHK